MNPIVLIAYNNVDLTRDAVASAFAQDIPVYLWLIDNGSTDGTKEWMDALEAPAPHCLQKQRYPVNASPLPIANRTSATIYGFGAQYILGMPNDAVLPPNLYSEFLKWPRGFVCASATGEQQFARVANAQAVSENTPMAVMLTRRWAYDALVAKDGYFMDENLFHYCNDCDLALRMASCGIRGVQLDIQFWHYGSASHMLAPQEEGDRMRQQADVDRAYFERKWGFPVTSLEYGARAGDINFRG